MADVYQASSATKEVAREAKDLRDVATCALLALAPELAVAQPLPVTARCAGAAGVGTRIGVLATTLLSLFLASEKATRPQERAVPDESCAELTTDDIRWGDEIVLLPVDASVTAPIIERAVERWQRCEGYATAFPRFAIGEGRGRRVKVRFEERLPSPGYCGRFAGETITVHRLARVDNRIVFCPPPARLLAHELGHVLGLRDVADVRVCQTSIMSVVVETRPPLQRVATAECSAAGRRWMTSLERDRETSTAARQAIDAGGTAASNVPR